MPKIFCNIGRIETELQKEAFIKYMLTDPPIEIEPCTGCEAPKHLKRLSDITEVSDATTSLKHSVYVINNPDVTINGQVVCDCECKITH